ncbi:MAG: MerR family transcriptional regulator [Actinobacteria bacterium]|nr:MerR family transcriptional regulator [Actinomycetota bacterium]
MEHLKVREAARRLNVSPSTLRAWEQRFGFPRPARSPGGHRLYRHADIVALRDALEQGLSISSAISRVRQGHTVDAEALVGPLRAIDSERAASVVEAALALRSLERTVEEVLLPALAQVHRRNGSDSVEWAFAASWVGEWIRWARRLALNPSHPLRVLVGDATRGELMLDAAHAAALQLFCTRAGAHVLRLPVQAMKGVAGAVARFAPDVIVVTACAGHTLDAERWIAVARPAAGGAPVALYLRDADAVSTIQGVRRLDASPLAAQQELMRIARAAPAARAG